LNSKLKRECAHATRNYLCAKSCNDIDRKADARTLVFVQDFAPRLGVDPRLTKYIGDSDYSCDELPLGTETERQSTSSTPYCRNTKSRRPRPSAGQLEIYRAEHAQHRRRWHRQEERMSR
jgi:hypothetical protein